MVEWDNKYIIGTLDSFKIPFKLSKELKKIYRLEKSKKCSQCILLTVCKKGCYTEKLMCKHRKENCFSPFSKIGIDILNESIENIIKNESYNLLNVIWV